MFEKVFIEIWADDVKWRVRALDEGFSGLEKLLAEG
jgi:hypothetical protein